AFLQLKVERVAARSGKGSTSDQRFVVMVDEGILFGAPFKALYDETTFEVLPSGGGIAGPVQGDGADFTTGMKIKEKVRNGGKFFIGNDELVSIDKGHPIDLAGKAFGKHSISCKLRRPSG